MLTRDVVGQSSPSAEVDVNAALVRQLLREQFPELSELPLREAASGWDNAMFRLGTELAVRLPRRAIAAPGALLEQMWLPMIAQRVTCGVPSPVRVGQPTATYRWPWTVVDWFDGQVLGDELPPASSNLAIDLGVFMGELHCEAPDGLGSSEIRGCSLSKRDETFRSTVAQLGSAIDRESVVEAWDLALSTPRWSQSPVIVHGDVHPLNIIVDHEHRLVAVIDFGDLSAGDPATDLAIAWTAFGSADRVTFRRSCETAGQPVDDDTWARARGWALNFAVLYLNNSADVPALQRIGARALDQVLGDQPG